MKQSEKAQGRRQARKVWRHENLERRVSQANCDSAAERAGILGAEK